MCVKKTLKTQSQIRYTCTAEISFITESNVSYYTQLGPCEQTTIQIHGLPSRLVTRSDERISSDEAALEDSSSDSNGDNQCFVCMERPADAVLLECGHSELCVECATVLWNQGRRCPLCRQGFAAVMRIVERDSRMVRAP
jgi:hypothetical protein